MNKKNLSKALKEALKNSEEKNRLQELAGLEPTGCVQESLNPNSKDYKDVVRALNAFTKRMNNNFLNEAENEEAPDKVCMKNVDLEGGTATGCWKGCPRLMCGGCDCYGPIGGGKGFDGVVNLPLKRGTVNEAEEKRPTPNLDKAIGAPNVEKGGRGNCIKNISNDGFDITFTSCGKKCDSSSDCPEGCNCFGKV